MSITENYTQDMEQKKKFKRGKFELEINLIFKSLRTKNNFNLPHFLKSERDGLEHNTQSMT
jgi:hypothetical protein